MDASDLGGGVCRTIGSMEEIRKEGRWAVRGGWTKYLADPDFHDHYRPDEEISKIHVSLKKDQKTIKVYRFIHLFSGIKRDGDLGFYLELLVEQTCYYGHEM